MNHITSFYMLYSDLPICSSARKTISNEIAQRVREDWVPPAVGIVHWDGKLMPSLQGGSSKEERLPVLVTDVRGTKLLGAPTLPEGLGEGETGGAIADAVVKQLKDWKADDGIVGMVFDTTSSNTGTS